MTDHVCLYVPYSDKETAKELGCKWDSDQRLWYCSKFKFNKNLKFNNITMCIENWGKRRETVTEERVDNCLIIKSPQDSTIKSHKIPEVVFCTSDQIKQRTEKDQIAYEESKKNYINKFISIG